MKFGKIKSIIEQISHRILVDSEGNFLADVYFPNPKIIDFLAKKVALGQGFTMVGHYPCIRSFWFPPLILHKKGKEWHLGYYEKHRKRHFSNFVDFFVWAKDFVPFYFLNEKNEIIFTQYPPKTQILSFMKTYIAEINQTMQYDYEENFANVLAKFANTGIRLKIIVADCKGDFYVTCSQIWVYSVGKKHFFNLHNLRPNIWQVDFVRKGNYLGIDRKIVQIIYKNVVLYSIHAFSEAEIAWRNDYFLNLIRDYYKKSKNIS